MRTSLRSHFKGAKSQPKRVAQEAASTEDKSDEPTEAAAQEVVESESIEHSQNIESTFIHSSQTEEPEELNKEPQETLVLLEEESSKNINDNEFQNASPLKSEFIQTVKLVNTSLDLEGTEADSHKQAINAYCLSGKCFSRSINLLN